MDHNLIEGSVEWGQPIRNYEFRRGVIRWLYSSADRDVEVDNMVFRGNVGIIDEGMQFTGDPQADSFVIHMPSHLDIPRMYRVIAPADVVYVIVRDYHYGNDTWVVSWIGTITGTKQVTEDLTHVICEYITSSLEIPGLRLGWQRSCPHTLYDIETCKVIQEDYEVPSVVADRDGLTIHCPDAGAFVNGYFSGGLVEWDLESDLVERRGIRHHEGNAMSILGGTYGLELGQAVRLYPGCFRTATICENKFNNILNHGGIPHLEGRSPYDGNSVW